MNCLPQFSGDCTKLHPAWFYLTTDTTFPVPAGTLVTVKCHDGLTNRGSETITCQNDIHFMFSQEPLCEPTGGSSKFYLIEREI